MLSTSDNYDETYTVGNVTPIEVNFALSLVEIRLGCDVINLKVEPPLAKL